MTVSSIQFPPFPCTRAKKVSSLVAQPAPPGPVGNGQPGVGAPGLPSQPVLRQLYNQAAIFVSPSWAEGWPLPPAEAMACGAADVLTDIGGHQEFAVDGVTASLVPAKQPDALADAVLALCLDRQRRIRLAEAGHNNILTFTWDQATDRLAQIIKARAPL